MTDHDDARIDAVLEALARPQPPADHVARVLARTSTSTQLPAGMHDQPATVHLRARWVLPVAATVLVALGATWQIGRQAQGAFDDAAAQGASAHGSGLPSWGAPEEVVRPVLPPQAYWGMDPFEEWKSLRPGAGFRVPGTGAPPGSGPWVRGTHRRPQRAGSAKPQWGWVPVPSGLPPIELGPITPSPIEIAPIAALEEITVEDIALAPIVVAPVDEQEKP